MKIELSEKCIEAIKIMKAGMDAAQAQVKAHEAAEKFAGENGLLATKYHERTNAIDRIQQFISDETIKAML